MIKDSDNEIKFSVLKNWLTTCIIIYVEPVNRTNHHHAFICSYSQIH